MSDQKRIWWLLFICVILCLGLCLGSWSKLNTQWETAHIEAQATRTWIDALTMHYGEELSRLTENYEYERRKGPQITDLTVNVTYHYVLEYTETRCQTYAAVAINAKNIYNTSDDRPCGFCAIYVFTRIDSQQPWEFGTFLPIMWSADDLARDWNTHKELGTYEGFIDICPQWKPCPYSLCTTKK